MRRYYKATRWSFLPSGGFFFARRPLASCRIFGSFSDAPTQHHPTAPPDVPGYASSRSGNGATAPSHPCRHRNAYRRVSSTDRSSLAGWLRSLLAPIGREIALSRPASPPLRQDRRTSEWRMTITTGAYLAGIMRAMAANSGVAFAPCDLIAHENF